MKNNLYFFLFSLVLLCNSTSRAEDDIKNKLDITIEAQRLFASGDGESALKKLDNIINNIQNRGVYWNVAASEKIRILSAMGRVADAINFGNDCIAGGADSDILFIEYGNLLFDCGIYSKSLDVYNKIKDKDTINAFKTYKTKILFAIGDLDSLFSLLNERPYVNRTIVDGVKRAIDFIKDKQEPLSSTFEYLIIDHHFKSINEPLREYLSKAFLYINNNEDYFSELLKHRILFIFRAIEDNEHISDSDSLFTDSGESIDKIKKYISPRIMRGRK